MDRKVIDTAVLSLIELISWFIQSFLNIFGVLNIEQNRVFEVIDIDPQKV